MKVAVAASVRVATIVETLGGISGASATDLAQTQQVLTPSMWAAAGTPFDSGVVPQISVSEISPALNFTARWLLPARALAINWKRSTRPQAAANRPRPISCHVRADIIAGR
ncbi:hypothetical protein [Bosea sp. ANAM02]|uniref:hypothetical protein n=1 Tax=Bosea sp. ANAM02 TaxID=2020412 RepID=UPI001565B43D|nr:hypothetical protein [Bosea sp. ANAM02]